MSVELVRIWNPTTGHKTSVTAKAWEEGSYAHYQEDISTPTADEGLEEIIQMKVPKPKKKKVVAIENEKKPFDVDEDFDSGNFK